MSKRLGNAVDPFTTIAKYGADATRWYMISNSQPWDNLKFDIDGIEEVQRKFFGTLYNTYAFFALYANIDGFDKNAADVPMHQRPEIDRWVISVLHSLVSEVQSAMDDYEPTKASRLIQDFVNDQLSNWYVRLCRRRFWKTDDPKDKLAAYQTLYTCLKTIAQLMSPVAPFYSDMLYRNLLQADATSDISVHLSGFPLVDSTLIDADLEKRMDLAQRISSMVLSLRKKENIKVRQPLSRILIPVMDDQTERMVSAVSNLIMSEVNVKEIEFVKDTSGMVSKKVKPNFKLLGKKLGADMKAATAIIAAWDNNTINRLESEGSIELKVADKSYSILPEEVDILTEDIAGWLVTSDKGLTVALDVHMDDNLINEGLARELVNRIQNQRKDNNYEVTDKIVIQIQAIPALEPVIESFGQYICNETLAESISMIDSVPSAIEYEVNDLNVCMNIKKI